jgi:hypothetical protein
MRISGNILDRFLNIYLPAFMFYYFLSFFIPDTSVKGVTDLQRIYFLSGFVCLISLVDYVQVIHRKIKSLEIGDSVIIGRRKISDSDIISIKYRLFSRSFNIITFEVLQKGITEEISFMDKPKLFGIFGPKGSLTLNKLYYYFPQLKDKEI